MSYTVNLFPDQIEVRRNVRLGDGEKYEELVQSMKDQGQLVPIQVYQDEDTGHYVLQYGHQRLQAAKELGWDRILATVVTEPVDDSEALIQKTQENEARSPMSYMEKAHVYQQLIDNGMRAKEVAERFGVTKSVVSIALATLDADPKLQEAVASGKLAPSAVEPIIFQDAETQALLADAVINAKTVRKVKSVVNTYQRAGVVPGGDEEAEETVFDEDPLVILYKEQLAEAAHILSNIHPSWLDSPENLCAEDTFVDIDRHWNRILEECDNG